MNAAPPDDAQPPPQKQFEHHIVKVELPPPDGVGQAYVTNESGSVSMFTPAGLISKRFRVGERRGFFKADLDADGTLEIGDRVGDRSW